MASEVDICNLALSRLGDSATISSLDPPEGSAQAERCARFYPFARNNLLELHSWKFATRRARLAELATVDSYNFQYAYAEPAGALRILAVLEATQANDQDSHVFDTMSDETAGNIIVTDLADATVLYTVLATDSGKFPPLFVEALSWSLASMLAGPTLKGDAGAAEAKRCTAQFVGVLTQARTTDANQRNMPIEHTPAWIKAR